MGPGIHPAPVGKPGSDAASQSSQLGRYPYREVHIWVPVNGVFVRKEGTVVVETAVGAAA